MSELFCEEIAHRAGFAVSVGNWITPDGFLITGKNYDTHHWETIKEHLGYTPKVDNQLSWMNQQILEGYIRLVFRHDILFQVGCNKKEEIWEKNLNFIMMLNILDKVSDVEVHIFSRTFYIIGLSCDIINKSWNRLQIQEA